jgi:hypothetical protein
MQLTSITAPYTVEMLTEIVASQLTCFGDRQLIVNPSPKTYTPNIEIEVDGELLIECGGKSFMKRVGNTLSALLNRLNSLDEKSVIDTYYDVPINWRIGFFDKQEGFIETLSISDLPG